MIDPTKPCLLTQSIMEFLAGTKNGVVLLDGIESLVVYNDFNRALKVLNQINDFVMQYGGYLIVPINPEAFGERERAMIERNFETISVLSVLES